MVCRLGFKSGIRQVIFCFLCFVGADGKEWFVAPDGSASGDGSKERPWSLEVAIRPHPMIQPMDTVWLRRGIYNGAFVSRLRGAPGKPVILRAYPGERVILDGRGYSPASVLTIEGEWAWYWGLEITNSDPNRNASVSGSGTPQDRGGGISMMGANTKVINCIVHDTGTAVGQSKNIPEMELYGTIIFNNGWKAPDRWHGPGIYTQNATGQKTLRENIIFNSYWSNLQLYGSANSALNNFLLVGNVNFNGRWLVGGGAPLQNIVAIENMLYGNTAEFSYSNRENRNLVLRGNYFAVPVSAGMGWDRVTAEGNTFVVPRGGGSLVSLTISEGHALRESAFSGNTYFVGRGDQPVASVQEPGVQGSRAFRFSEWQELGFDRDGRLLVAPQGVPQEPQVFVRRNEYEPNRGHVVVFNWPRRDVVEVDISAMNPRPGDRWILRNVQNYFDEFESGIFDGKPLRVRMTGWTVAVPVGEDRPLRPSTFPEFGVFVLTLERGQGQKSALAADPGREGVAAPGALVRTELPAGFFPGTPVTGAAPFGDELAGVRVHLTDSEGRPFWARLAALTSDWVLWEVPLDSALGWARIRVIRVGEPEMEAGGVLIEKVAPALFTLDGGGRGTALGWVRYRDGAVEALADCGSAGCVPRAVDGARAEELGLMGSGFGGSAEAWVEIGGRRAEVRGVERAEYPGLEWVRAVWPAGIPPGLVAVRGGVGGRAGNGAFLEVR